MVVPVTLHEGERDPWLARVIAARSEQVSAPLCNNFF